MKQTLSYRFNPPQFHSVLPYTHFSTALTEEEMHVKSFDP